MQDNKIWNFISISCFKKKKINFVVLVRKKLMVVSKTPYKQLQEKSNERKRQGQKE